MAQVASAPSKRPRPSRGSERSAPGRVKPPVLKITRYDLVSSFMVAIVVGLVVTVVWVFLLWLANRPIKAEHVAEMELIELGGVEDGAPDETLKVESPEDLTQDPSVVEAEDVSEVEELIETVVELSPNAAQQVQQQVSTDATSAGKIGRADGSGRRPLGSGPGEGGMPRHQRWFVRFQDRGTLDEYARQLDFFGIELALWKEGKIHVVSKLSQPRPNVEVLTSGEGKQDQLYFTWQGGGRKQADIDLFKKAGIDARTGIILHFYPRDTVGLLARIEQEQSDRPVKQIRRTYFSVRRDGNGYEFVVTRITYF